MSTEKKPCGECATPQRVTAKGLVFKHGDCPGGGIEPLDPAQQLLDQMYTVEEVMGIVNHRKTGYTDEQLEKMLSDLTPKRQKLRERISARWHRFKKNLDDYFDGGWDVYDD